MPRVSTAQGVHDGRAMQQPCRLVLPLALAIALAGVTSCAGLLPVSSPPREARRESPPPTPVVRQESSNEEVRELVSLVQRYRRSRNLPELQWDARVAKVAQAHSEDMFRRGYFSHVNPDGQSPFDRLLFAGIRYRAAAENIAQGQETPEEVFGSWVNSPGHRRNLDNPAFTHQGIGLYRDHWTHVLLKRR